MSGESFHGMLETCKRLRALEDSIAALKGRAPGSTYSHMPDGPSRDEVAARLEAAEARTEARFSQLSATLEGRFGQIEGKFGRMEAAFEHVTDAITTLTGEVRESRRHALAMWLTVLIAVVGIGVAVWQGVISSQSALITAVQTGVAIQQGAQQPSTTPSAPSANIPTSPQIPHKP